MMGVRGSFFLMAFRRNAARQRRMQQAGEQGRSQSSLQSPEPSEALDCSRLENEGIEGGASSAPGLAVPKSVAEAQAASR
jgi:hypothetical protein